MYVCISICLKFKFETKPTMDIWDDDYIAEAVLLIMQDSDTTDTSDSDSYTDFDTDSSDDEDEYEAFVTSCYAWRMRFLNGMAPNGPVGVIATKPKTKIVNGKLYHFCMNHNKGRGAWVVHHPTKCKNPRHKPEEPETEHQGTKRSLAMAFEAEQDAAADDFSDEE